MKYVFFGTPEFAATILRRLIAVGQPPALVICNPDRPVGRKQLATAPPAKVAAAERGIAVWQPERLDPVEARGKLAGFDVAVIAAYAKIIPASVLALPRLGMIGVHPSLLPRHRGATPIQAAILSGDAETGVTLFVMDEKVDHGPILARRTLAIGQTDTYATLHDKLAQAAADLLIEMLPKFLKKEIAPQPQDEAQATYTKKFTAEDGFVNLEADGPELVWRKVRAMNPEPGVYTFKEGQRMKILEADLVNGKLALKKIQFEGKKIQLLTKQEL